MKRWAVAVVLLSVAIARGDATVPPKDDDDDGALTWRGGCRNPPKQWGGLVADFAVALDGDRATATGTLAFVERKARARFRRSQSAQSFSFEAPRVRRPISRRPHARSTSDFERGRKNAHLYK